MTRPLSSGLLLAALLAGASAALAAPPASPPRPGAPSRCGVLLHRTHGGDIRLGGPGTPAERSAEARLSSHDSLIVTRDARTYEITDAATLRAVGAAVAPLTEMGRRQAALGARQAALGGQQAALGAQQAARAQAIADRVQRAVAAGNTPPDGGASGATPADLARRQEELGRRQEALGHEQAALGAQMSALAVRARSQVDSVVDTAFAHGLARPLD